MSARHDDRPHVDRILAILQGVRRSGQHYAARCPVSWHHAHGDRDASLTVLVDHRGKVAFKCHAQTCTPDQVRERLGLDVSDLYAPENRTCNARHGMLREHPYVDEDGEVLYVVRRYDRDRDKFRPFHPDTSGRLVPGLPDGRRVLYRLPQLVEADRMNATLWPVYITEGERDADTLATRCAPMLTTTVHNSWNGVDVSYLAEREVIVVVDNDPAGWNRGRAAADTAHTAGASIVSTMRPPWRFRDVSDMLAAGLDCGALEPVNLHTEHPPQSWPEDERPRRPVANRTGDAQGIRVPLGVFLLLEERGDLQPLRDRHLWERLEDRAHLDTHEASMTVVELAELEQVHRGTVSRALDRLEQVGLISKVRRGRWQVFNPAWPDRHGDVDLTGSYRNGTDQPPLYVPLHSHVPYMSPGNAAPGTHSQEPDAAFANPNAARGTHSPHEDTTR